MRVSRDKIRPPSSVLLGNLQRPGLDRNQDAPEDGTVDGMGWDGMGGR